MKSNTLLIGVVALLAAAAAYWFLLLAPKRDEVTALSEQVTQKEAEAAQAQATLASYRQAQQTFRVNYSTIARLGKAVPADDDVRSLVVQLEGAANKSKTDFRSIAVSAGGGSSATPGTTTENAPPPGSQSVGPAGFAVMPFALQFTGGYMDLSKLFTELEGFVEPKASGLNVRGRLLRVESFKLSPSEEGSWKTLAAEINASTYLTPAAEGLTGGATATGPAPSTTSASAPSDSSDDDGSAITPATVTGALR